MRLKPFELPPPRVLAKAAQRAMQAFLTGPPSGPIDNGLAAKVRAYLRSGKGGETFPLQLALTALAMLNANQLDENEAHRAITLFATRRRPLAFHSLWEVYQNHFENQDLRAHLGTRALLEASEAVTKHVGALFSSDPVGNIQRKALASNLRLDQITPTFGLDKHRRLRRDVFRRILLQANTAWYRRLTEQELQAALGYGAFSSKDKLLRDARDISEFFTGVIRSHGDPQVLRPRVINDDPVLRNLVSRVISELGEPPKAAIPWSFIPADVKKLVRGWLNEREILAFFNRADADPARRDFWRRYAFEIDDIFHHTNTNVFAMSLGTHVYVEFGEGTGALYVYSMDSFSRLRARNASSESGDPGIWKDRGLLIDLPRALRNFGLTDEARFGHHSGWQWKFQHVIRSLDNVNPA